MSTRFRRVPRSLRGLSALPSPMLAEANSTIDKVNAQLRPLNELLVRMQQLSYGDEELGRVRRQQEQFITRLEDLAAEIPGLDESSYAYWLQRVGQLSRDVEVETARHQTQVSSGAGRRASTIVLTTVGLLIGGGLLVGLFYSAGRRR